MTAHDPEQFDTKHTDKTKNWKKLWEQLIVCMNDVQLPIFIITGASVLTAVCGILILWKLISVDSKLTYITRYTMNGIKLF